MDYFPPLKERGSFICSDVDQSLKCIFKHKKQGRKICVQYALIL